MNLIEKSLEIALQAHAGQTDKAGRPYILHPLRIMARMVTTEELSVALLHDVLEDSEWTVEALLQAGIPQTVVDAVQCLTKVPGEDYEQFIQRVRSNPLASKIKQADIEDNIDVLRLDSLAEEDIERVKKYHAAWNVLDKEATKPKSSK